MINSTDVFAAMISASKKFARFLAVVFALVLVQTPSVLQSSPVTNLTFQNVSSDTLSYQWTNQLTSLYQTTLSTVPGFSIVLASGVTGMNQNTTDYRNLQPNTSHTFLVKVSTDGDANYIALSTFTLSKSPGFTGFQVFTTSVTVFLINNGNPVGSTATYRVQVSSDGFNSISFSSQGINGNNAAAPSLTAFGLTPNSTYQIRIDALNFLNLPSSVTTVSNSTATSAAPPSIVEFQVFTTSISVTLGANGNPAGTPLMISTGNAGYFDVARSSIGIVAGANTTLTILGLSTNTAYAIQAGARDTTPGASTQPVTVTAATTTLAVVPSLAGFNMFLTSATVTLGLNTNPAGTRLEITTGSFETSTSSSGFITTFTMTGLSRNTTYTIQARAVNSTGAVTGNLVVASTSTLAADPAASTILTVNTSSITITWGPNGNPLSPPTSYQVRISTDVGFSVYTTSVSFAVTITTVGMNPGTSYYFKAAAFSHMGEITNFNNTVATVTLPAALYNLTSPAQTVSSIQLVWQSSNAAAAKIEVSSSTDNFSTQITTPIPFSAGLTGTTTTLFNLREKTTYYFRLRVQSEGNIISDFSQVLTTNTTSVNPEGISNLAYDAAFPGLVDGDVRLNWTAPGGDEQSVGINVVSYLVHYATFDISTAQFDLPTVSTFTQNWVPLGRGSVEQYTVTGLNPGATYFFAIKGVDAAGNKGFWSAGGGFNTNRSFFAKDLPPASPTNPTIGLVTSTSIALSWTGPPSPTYVDDRSSYTVYWATYNFSSSGDPFVFKTTGSVHPVNFVTVTGLANEVQYFFRVSATDKGDQGSGLYSDVLESALSASTSATTLDAIAPAAISDLTSLTGVNEGEVILQWTAPGDDGTSRNLPVGSIFEIKYSSVGIITASNYAAPPAGFTRTISTQTTQGSAQGWVVTGLQSDTTYWFAMKTKDESGNVSIWNSSTDVTTLNLLVSTRSQRDIVPPVTVSGLSLTPGYKRISLSWIAPGDDNITGNLTGQYLIKYGTPTITSLAEFNAAPSTMTISTSGVKPGLTVTMLITGLLTNVTYYFGIRAIDDAGNFSPFFSTQTQSDFPRNQAPSVPTFVSPANGFIVNMLPAVLSWNASTDPNTVDGDTVTYTIEVSTRPDFAAPFVSSGTTVSPSTNVTTSLIEDSTTYWRVRARDLDSYEVISSSRIILINLVNTVPSTFSLLVPTNTAVVTVSTPTLDWQDSIDPDPGDILTYTLKYSQNLDAEGGTIVTGLTTSVYVIPSGLSENTTYYWKVSAISTRSAAGGGYDEVKSSTFVFSVNSIPEAPNPFSLISPADSERIITTTPTFVWQQTTDNDPGDTISYTLTISNVLFSTAIANISGSTYTLAVPLTDNRPYSWTVVAKSQPDGLTRAANPSGGRLIKVDTVKQLPPAVTLTTPTLQNLVNTSSPTLKWTSVTDPDNADLAHPQMDRVRYIVRIGKKADYSDVLGQQIFFSDNNGFDTQRTFSLEDQTTYFWQVAAAGYQPIGPGSTYINVDTGGVAGCSSISGTSSNECFSLSTQFSFIVSLVNTPPTAANLSQPANGLFANTTLFTFKWTDSIDPDPGQTLDYTIQISTESNFASIFFSTSGLTVSSFTLASPLLQNRTYFWRVFTQDRFNDGRTAGNPVQSGQTNNFRVPMLTTPKEPTSVKGALSSDKNSYAITWNAVTQNTDGTTISDLDGYNIYRSSTTSGLGTGTPFAKAGSGIQTLTDFTVQGRELFYVIRAVNTSFLLGDSSGTISINSLAVKSSADNALLVVPNDPDIQGKIEIVVPEDVKSVLEKGNNPFGEDLKFDITKTEAPGLKNALLGIEIKIKTANSDRDIGEFTFSKPIRVAFPVTSALLAGKYGAPSAVQGAASSADELGVFWNNRIEWINLGSSVDPANNSIFIKTRNVGQFGVKKAQKATQFEIFAITPNRIFTPNGDGCNDVIAFQFQNPKGVSGIKGKIFDLYGAFIADMKPATSIAALNFNSNCAKPNLSDDTFIWDGKDNDGSLVRKGIYVYQIEVEGKAYNGTVVVAR